MSVPCTVKLDLFEGPLDLLLHLIKRSEVQITDVRIAAITDQYLAMLDELPELNLDGAGEYLVMAATLTYLKSRELLPAAEDEEDGEEEDPRAALVQQLLEYQRFREAAVALGERSILTRDVFATAGEPAPPPGPEEPQPPPVRDASLGDLLDALRDVLRRRTPPRAHEVSAPVRLSVAQCVQRILARFALADEVEFVSLFDPEAPRGEVIVTFLALLELIKMRIVRARQSEQFGPIVLGLAVADIAEAATLAADVGRVEEWKGGGEVADGHGST